MRMLVKEQLSKHRYKTPEGYLVCVDAILARTGKQRYTRDDIYGNGDMTEIDVDRKPEEVFDPKAIASFENKPVTIEHPDVNVGPDNFKELAVGFVRDVHKGDYKGQPVLLGTIVVTDSEAIKNIEEGTESFLSCGYDCDVTEGDNPEQKNIRGNHVALCEIPRAGITKIQDSLKGAKKMKKKKNDVFLTDKSFSDIVVQLQSDKDKEILETLSDKIKTVKKNCKCKKTLANIKEMEDIIKSEMKGLSEEQKTISDEGFNELYSLAKDCDDLYEKAMKKEEKKPAKKTKTKEEAVEDGADKFIVSFKNSDEIMKSVQTILKKTKAMHTEIASDGVYVYTIDDKGDNFSEFKKGLKKYPSVMVRRITDAFDGYLTAVIENIDKLSARDISDIRAKAEEFKLKFKKTDDKIIVTEKDSHSTHLDEFVAWVNENFYSDITYVA